MSTLSYLQSSLSNLQERKRVAEEKLKVQKQREKDIKGIIAEINDKFDDYIGDITKHAKNTSEDIQEGVNGSVNLTDQSYIVNDEYEKYPESDSRLSSSLSNLKSELSVVANKIIELENEIASLKIQIIVTQDAIQAEIRRIEEEARAAREAAAREASARESAAREASKKTSVTKK
jgi:predicted  nucleic acid-binding Zn-ribbon protein